MHVFISLSQIKDKKKRKTGRSKMFVNNRNLNTLLASTQSKSNKNLDFKKYVIVRNDNIL